MAIPHAILKPCERLRTVPSGCNWGSSVHPLIVPENLRGQARSDDGKGEGNEARRDETRDHRPAEHLHVQGIVWKRQAGMGKSHRATSSERATRRKVSVSEDMVSTVGKRDLVHDLNRKSCGLGRESIWQKPDVSLHSSCNIKDRVRRRVGRISPAVRTDVERLPVGRKGEEGGGWEEECLSGKRRNASARTGDEKPLTQKDGRTRERAPKAQLGLRGKCMRGNTWEQAITEVLPGDARGKGGRKGGSNTWSTASRERGLSGGLSNDRLSSHSHSASRERKTGLRARSLPAVRGWAGWSPEEGTRKAARASSKALESWMWSQNCVLKRKSQTNEKAKEMSTLDTAKRQRK